MKRRSVGKRSNAKEQHRTELQSKGIAESRNARAVNSSASRGMHSKFQGHLRSAS